MTTTIKKESVNELKIAGNGAFSEAIGKLKDSGSIALLLQKLGHLPKDFDGNLLLPLLNNESSQVRFWVVKNLGKLEDLKYQQVLSKIAKEDTDSMVRREAVSSIGRMRNPQNKSILIELLTVSGKISDEIV